MEKNSDVLIIGGGVTGCAVARELSRYEVSITVLEQAVDVAEGASKANSGIVHAGYDAAPGTLKARYNTAGALMFQKLCEELGVSYQRCGALVVGFNEDDRSTLEELKARGIINGVPDLRIIEHDELMAMEPEINQTALCALYVPTSAIVSPYEFTFALADDAAANGVNFCFGKRAVQISRSESGQFTVITDNDVWNCKILINCAGASSVDLHNQISDRKLKMIHRRGQYYLLDRPSSLPFTHTIFQCPSRMGKGVLVSPTIHGNVLLGPSAEDIDDPLDTATTQAGLDAVMEKVRLTWPGVSLRTNITNFSGVRAHEIGGDFIIGPVAGCSGSYEAVGIESPGLSSAPAIGNALSELIARDLSLHHKASIVSYRKPCKPFREMTAEEQQRAIKENPQYGNIICRCEVVSEAEIVDAIHRPVPATTVDGVKRRTRAGMGRCQGGFCCPRVASLISRECGIPLIDVTKNGGSSYLLTGTLNSTAERRKGES